jgi:Mce-associated membrane protein
MAGSPATADREVTTRRVNPRSLAVGALAVVLVVLAVLAFLQTLSIRHHNDLDARRSAAINAASDEVVALLTVRHSTATADLKRLLDGSTADFHDQLQKQAQTFRQALTSGKVTSTGSIAGAALVSMAGDNAVVGIAAKATVKNTASPNGEARNYRLTVTVSKVGGAWLVSGLTFVV